MIQHLAGFVLRGFHRLIEVGIAGITLASVDEFEPIARAGGAPFGSHLPPAGDFTDNLGAAVEFAAPDLDVVHCLHHEYVGDVNLVTEAGCNEAAHRCDEQGTERADVSLTRVFQRGLQCLQHRPVKGGAGEVVCLNHHFMPFVYVDKIHSKRHWRQCPIG